LTIAHPATEKCISRKHATITLNANGCFEIEALGKNGVTVTDPLNMDVERHIKPGETPIQLKTQDLVRMGSQEFCFLLPAP